MKGESKGSHRKKKMEIVIGSWGSYNACNERALGSKWLDLADFDSWEAIEEELTKQGFELNGIDEELFIQDIEGEWGFNCDYMHPKRLFELMAKADILGDERKEEMANAYIEAQGWNDFVDLVERKENDWDEDIYFYKDMTPEEVAQDMVWSCYPDLDFTSRNFGWLSDYIEIDYKRIAEDSPYFYVSSGTIEIR